MRAFSFKTFAPLILALASTSWGQISDFVAQPATISAGLGTSTLVTCKITEPNVLPDSVLLQRLDANGAVTGTLGNLRDTGTNGDVTAGDFIFSGQFGINEANPGILRLRVSIGIRGSARRVLSSILQLTVTGTATSVRILSPSRDAYLSLSPVVVRGTIGDPTLGITVNGIVATKSGTDFTASVPLIEGTNTLTAVTTTAGGASSSDSLQVVLDTTAPRVTISTPTEGFRTTAPNINVSGIVNDIVVGTVNPLQASVTVNGFAAQVANRTFNVSSLPLVVGTNTIRAEGRDRAGNTFVQSITVFRDAPAPNTAALQLLSGNNQTGAINSALPAPLVVQVTNAAGQPASGVPVTFRVTENNGLVNALPAAVVNSDAQGRAQVAFQLGSRSGAGGNRVEAFAGGFQGTAIFTASANPATPARIIVDSGLNQTGATGRALPFPFVAVVTDAGNNRLTNVPVTFTVRAGGGTINGLVTFATTSDSDGRVMATLTQGLEEGISNNVVEVNFTGNTGQAAVFTSTALTPGPVNTTSISGVVQDNSNQPIAGVTIRLFQLAQGVSNGQPLQISTPVVTDPNGAFRIPGAPVGTMKLMADGSTALPNGAWPTLEFDLTTVAGRDNNVGTPIYLPRLDQINRLCVTASTGGTLTLPNVPGFSLTVAPGSATFPGGSRTGCISVTPVNPDKVPMVPGFGQQPRFVVTIQPVGTMFNPPAQIVIPNVDGLAPREKTEMYSYDHDLASFVSIGSGTTSADASVVASDPGVGVIKAGWHCGGNPAPTGTAGECGQCARCVGTQCQEDLAKRGQTCNLPSGSQGVCTGGYCRPIQVEIQVNQTAITSDDITSLNGVQQLPVTVKLLQGPSTPVTINLEITPMRGSLSQTTVSLANGQSAIVNITPTSQSSVVNDGQIIAKYGGTQVALGRFTVVKITLPTNIKASNNPSGVPDRIPPRIDTRIRVTLQPSLVGSGQKVTLDKEGNSTSNGDFAINNSSTLEIEQTSDVTLRGSTQTAATGGRGGGNAGNLKLIAKVRNTKATETPGFTVAAMPLNYTDRLVGPVTDPGRLGLIVQDGWESDSGVLSDLDQVDISEQVEVSFVDIPPFSPGGLTSSYLPAVDLTQDTHGTPDTVLAGPAGRRVAEQTCIYRCRRVGVVDIPMINSGFRVNRTVFPSGSSFKLTTEKIGRATSANGFPSQAGAILGPPAIVTQP